MAETIKPTDVLKEAAASQSETDLARVMAGRLKAKETELEQRETDLEKKKKDFEEFVKTTELGGKSFAGQMQSKEETPQEYARKILRGQTK